MFYIKYNLADLKIRAARVREDKNIRHIPSAHDIDVCRQNAILMQEHQYNTIKAEAEHEI